MTNKYKAGDIIIWGDGNNKIIAAQIIKVYKKTYYYKFILHSKNYLINTFYRFDSYLVEKQSRLMTDEDKLKLL